MGPPTRSVSRRPRLSSSSKTRRRGCSVPSTRCASCITVLFLAGVMVVSQLRGWYVHVAHGLPPLASEMGPLHTSWRRHEHSDVGVSVTDDGWHYQCCESRERA